jgi:prevent-host-death family protein
VAEVTIRDLRNRGGEVVDRVAAGEQVTITRGGKPVAELVPARRKALGVAALQERRRALPYVDPAALRTDLDSVLNPSL